MRERDRQTDRHTDKGKRARVVEDEISYRKIGRS